VGASENAVDAGSRAFRTARRLTFACPESRSLSEAET